MPCIILAGGLGTRLKSEVPNLPKCLAPVRGYTFLELQLRSLADRGFNYFILALGYRAGDVMDELASDWARQYRIEVVTEPEPLGTGGAIRNAMRNVNAKEAIVVNGDTFVGGQLNRLWAPQNSAVKNMTVMAVVMVPDISRFGGVQVDTDGKVCSFQEKATAGAGLINAGIYRISLDTLDAVSDEKFSLELSLLPYLVNQGSLYSEVLPGPFIDIGTPADYRFFSYNLERFVKEK